MDISILQRQKLTEMTVSNDEVIDSKYISLLSHFVKTDLIGYAERNPTKRIHYWADYHINTSLKKPSYNELKAVKELLKPQFTNMKISVETVKIRGNFSRSLVPVWNRLTFRW
jgi:hypothetical protein